MKEIIERVKSSREEKRITQLEMANKLGLSLVSYSKIERGKTDLSVKRLFEIAEILGVGVDTLLGYKNNNDNSSDKLEELMKENRFYRESFETVISVLKHFFKSSESKKDIKSDPENITKYNELLKDFKL
jgi:transcriptional regulator with XRE-family HTH domain